MLKQYTVIYGIRGILEGTRIERGEFELQEVMLDLAQVISVQPQEYWGTISNWKEHNDLRDEEWHRENPDPLSCMHPPSMMTTGPMATLPCTMVQIGTQTYYFPEEASVIFRLVAKELNKS